MGESEEFPSLPFLLFSHSPSWKWRFRDVEENAELKKHDEKTTITN